MTLWPFKSKRERRFRLDLSQLSNGPDDAQIMREILERLKPELTTRAWKRLPEHLRRYFINGKSGAQ